MKVKLNRFDPFKISNGKFLDSRHSSLPVLQDVQSYSFEWHKCKYLIALRTQVSLFLFDEYTNALLYADPYQK
nr:MAG TPA: hypothetical protein [Caudoviricetes sp.]